MATLIRLLALGPALLLGFAPQAGEYQLKGELLVRFADFVVYPEGTFADEDSPFVIGVFGDDPFGALLEQTTEARRVKGRRIEVRRFASLADLAAFGAPHVLFVPQSERPNYREVFDALEGQPVLTVGEEATFARDRGMINLTITEARPHLEIANHRAEAVGLRISPQLLSISEILHTDAPAP
jgi:hypothetical protein